ncbi:MAG: HAD hydrolase family protein [Algisphaera sp.]
MIQSSIQYDLIALDLDGTLVAPGERISEASHDAISAAQAAGVRVVPCTGRAWKEAAAVLKGVSGLDVGVFSSGSVVADFRTGKVLDTASFALDLVHDVVELLSQWPCPVLVFQNAQQTGRDFLIAGRGVLPDSTYAWFERNDLAVDTIPSPSIDDLAHTLRVGIVAPSKIIDTAERAVNEQFEGRVNAHSLTGIAATVGANGEQLYLLEIFNAGVNKWRGLYWLAQHLDIAPHRVAAMGDEVNDLAMLKGAALGVAMGGASEAVMAAANRTTHPCAQDGVAHAIEQILNGTW